MSTKTGAFQLDAQHGWHELHPVWSVRINGGLVFKSGPQSCGSPPGDRSGNSEAD